MASETYTKVVKKTKKIFRIVSILLLLFLVIFIYMKYFFTYSDGYRSGLLQKFSHKGNIFKTYEGEMILSSVTSNRNVPLASEKFLFSVTDKNLALQLDTIQGQFVSVHYHQKHGKLFWRGESEYFVDNVKILK
jgi:hypothetical protein